MWDAYIHASIALYAMQAEQAESLKFNDALAKMTPDQASEAISVRAEMKEKQRKEAIEASRHREIVDAIRSTKPSASSPTNYSSSYDSGSSSNAIVGGLVGFGMGLAIGNLS